MDSMAMALALIKAYKDQHNRGLRARRVFARLHCREVISDHGFSPIVGDVRRNWDYRNKLRYFFDHRGVARKNIFVSNAVKATTIRCLKKQLNVAILRGYESSIKTLSEELEQVKLLPVLTEVGKQWQAYVKAHREEQQAYDKKYAIRSAIKVFNELKTGIHIKFGNCRNGPKDRIYSVVVNDEEIRVSNFIKNAEFETAILAA